MHQALISFPSACCAQAQGIFWEASPSFFMTLSLMHADLPFAARRLLYKMPSRVSSVSLRGQWRSYAHSTVFLSLSPSAAAAGSSSARHTPVAGIWRGKMRRAAGEGVGWLDDREQIRGCLWLVQILTNSRSVGLFESLQIHDWVIIPLKHATWATDWVRERRWHVQENWVSSRKAGKADATEDDCDLQTPPAGLHSAQMENVSATSKRLGVSKAFAHLPGKIHFPLFTTTLSTCKCGALNVVGTSEVHPALFWSVTSDTNNWKCVSNKRWST